MRWLFSILVTLAFAAGIYFFYQTWAGYNAQQEELAFLEQEQRNYEKLKQQYAEQEEKVVLINSLWDEIDAVGLAPNNWVMYPLNIDRTIPWGEVSDLLRLAANNMESGGYWFMPKRLRVARVLGPIGGERAPRDDEPVTIVAAEDETITPQQVGYAVTLQGKFMIPKQ